MMVHLVMCLTSKYNDLSLDIQNAWRKLGMVMQACNPVLQQEVDRFLKVTGQSPTLVGSLCSVKTLSQKRKVGSREGKASTLTSVSMSTHTCTQTTETHTDSHTPKPKPHTTETSAALYLIEATSQTVSDVCP